MRLLHQSVFSTRSAIILVSLVITHFSKIVFRHIMEAINEPSSEHKELSFTLREFCKHHFHIVACLMMIENTWEGVIKRLSLLPRRSFGRKGLSNVTLMSLRQYPVEPIVNEIASLAKIMGLEVDNDIDELVEDRSQGLTNEELTEFHCISQQEVVEESLSDEEEVIAKQQSSSAIREMPKVL
ncbi:hypothetical protein AVEN_13100-1 [Araneus ventricosus]|uniref:Uncharacterized protein n=1 Tax=Araneus ventricosus TaxID=182803 RepID=A0A4Y2RVG7_ARAVE|nr:hypothetical protein AVEN_120145-1 [Araneus ventricosus]GBN79872.1 hypothetical protein AVEN_13100-1 [Araneus ventricosus]